MMTLMAKDVERIQTASGHAANVAVGLVDKPLIFAKSTLTWDLFKQQQSPAKPRLHWVVGFDTLYRVFQLKYYPSLEEFQQQCLQFFEREGTTFVCARRDPSSYPQLISGESSEQDAEQQARREEDKLLASENVAPWVERGSVGMLDIDPDQAKLSSTKIRSLLKDDSVDDKQKKERLEGLVPPSLVEYLVESKIYRDGAEG
uniref:Nicotinamide-nucleotide adenylyltransferase n=2 Tax=Kalmanozyma brasiliensis (strain GHG001) TaxID=1365824 RepID=V5ELW6_KALBG